MDKATELLEALNNLENSPIEEHAYFHTFQRAVNKRQGKGAQAGVTTPPAHSPLSFSPASKEEEKVFGKGTILNHNVNNGITTHTHVVKKSVTNPSAFEHHFYTFHQTGDKAGSIKSKTVTGFHSQADAENHASKISHEMANATFKSKAIKAVTKAAKSQLHQLGTQHAPSYAKHLLKHFGKSLMPF